MYLQNIKFLNESFENNNHSYAGGRAIYLQERIFWEIWLPSFTQKLIVTRDTQLFWGFSRPTMHRFFTSEKQLEEKSIEFAMDLLWISLHFWKPNAITLQLMVQDAGIYRQLGHQQTD